ncbi:MAG: phosphotransferase family protein [Actinobacteria bacterium]|nr:phosphotransferase family protein [Actinomycetota bacterium]
MAGAREKTEGPPGLDLEVLRGWFAAHVDGADGSGPLRAEMISGGRSNLTYGVGNGIREWVLRRPPLGHVLPTAHDMGREYRVMTALAGTDVPVPRMYAFCDDESVIGAPFYVMERVTGVIVTAPDQFAAISEADGRRCSQRLVEVLAAIHDVDYHAVGLGEFGRPDGYLARQVERWAKQWEGNKTRELGEIDELTRRLRAAVPAESDSAIVHGDYRLDNTMLDPSDAGRILAVLDWEMSTLGDPLADLGLLLVYWGGASGEMLPQTAALAAHPGFFAADEVVDTYTQVSGRNVDELDFHVVLAYYKLAIILEGIHARFLKGKTVGEGFDHVGAGVPFLAGAALDIASKSSVADLRG